MNTKANAYIIGGVLVAYFASKSSGGFNEHENPFQQVHRKIKQKKQAMKPVPQPVFSVAKHHGPTIDRLSGFPETTWRSMDDTHKTGYKPPGGTSGKLWRKRRR